MKCKECNKDDFYIDDLMGETICSNCGYVQVTNIFEERTSNVLFQDGERHYLSGDFSLGSKIDSSTKGSNKLTKKLLLTQSRFRQRKNVSINRGIVECNMILSPYLPNRDLKERVISYYKKLYFDHKFHGTPLSLRACAIVIICLRESGIPLTIAELAKNNNENPHKISKLARRYARYLGKSHILHKMPINSWVDRICFDLSSSREFTSETKTVVEYIYAITDDYGVHFSRSYMASAIWITSLLRKIGKPEHTQQEICEACNCTSVAQRLSAKKLFNLLGTSKQKLQYLDVNSFVAGIR